MVSEITEDCNKWHVSYEYPGSFRSSYFLTVVNKRGGIIQHPFCNILQDAWGPKKDKLILTAAL